MPSSGILQEFNGTLVVPAAGATVTLDGEPLKKYASFHSYIADVDEAIKGNIQKGPGTPFNLKQCTVTCSPEGHNKFNVVIVYFRPPDIEGGKVLQEYEPRPVSGSIMWRVTGE